MKHTKLLKNIINDNTSKISVESIQLLQNLNKLLILEEEVLILRAKQFQKENQFLKNNNNNGIYSNNYLDGIGIGISRIIKLIERTTK